MAFDGACGRDKARQFYEGTSITSTPKDSMGFPLAAFEEGSFAIKGNISRNRFKKHFYIHLFRQQIELPSFSKATRTDFLALEGAYHLKILGKVIS